MGWSGEVPLPTIWIVTAVKGWNPLPWITNTVLPSPNGWLTHSCGVRLAVGVVQDCCWADAGPWPDPPPVGWLPGPRSAIPSPVPAATSATAAAAQASGRRRQPDCPPDGAPDCPPGNGRAAHRAR